MPKRVVLAYSGGLDTSVAVRWMTDNLGVDVIALAVNVGQDGGEIDEATIRHAAPSGRCSRVHRRRRPRRVHHRDFLVLR